MQQRGSREGFHAGPSGRTWFDTCFEDERNDNDDQDHNQDGR